MVRNVPIATVSIRIGSSIVIDCTAEIVPLSAIMGVLEADHVVDLGARGRDFNPRFERRVEISIATLLLDMIREV